MSKYSGLLYNQKIGWLEYHKYKHPYNTIKKVFDILCMMVAFQHGDEEVNDGVP